jgi:hypothetical protein
MVAYSYKSRFVVPILVGLGLVTEGAGAVTVNNFEISTFVRTNLPRPKRQTIRALGKRRHARPGETLQHYTAMRTKQCRKIGEARCTEVRGIIIWVPEMAIMIDSRIQTARQIQNFARSDGFDSVADMQQFWAENHPDIKKFEGVLVEWEPLA